MIPDERPIVIYKFSEQQWIDYIKNGVLSFSCSANFIEQAKATGNRIQGDELDGVFARVKRNDFRVMEMQHRLKDDLEIIPDQNHVFLRRKSATLKPIFCYFVYTAGDIIDFGNIISAGKQVVTLKFDSKMFTGFANVSGENVVQSKRRFTILAITAIPFIGSVALSLVKLYRKSILKPIQYISFNSEFFYEPTPDYSELFFKSDVYSYQHEYRICLLDMDFAFPSCRYSLNIQKLNSGDYTEVHEEIETDFVVDIAEVNK